MYEEIKPGEETSEYKETQSAKLWGVVAMILGFILGAGSQILEAFGGTSNTELGIIGGAVIAVAGIIHTALVQLGYIDSRTQLKKESAK